MPVRRADGKGYAPAIGAGVRVIASDEINREWGNLTCEGGCGRLIRDTRNEGMASVVSKKGGGFTGMCARCVGDPKYLYEEESPYIRQENDRVEEELLAAGDIDALGDFQRARRNKRLPMR